MKRYDRIIHDCFWDMNISKQELRDIVRGNDAQKKSFLFEKILLNSTFALKDLTIFDDATLKNLIREFKVTTFNAEYRLRKINIAEVHFLQKPLTIDELKWLI